MRKIYGFPLDLWEYPDRRALINQLPGDGLFGNSVSSGRILAASCDRLTGCENFPVFGFCAAAPKAGKIKQQTSDDIVIRILNIRNSRKRMTPVNPFYLIHFSVPASSSIFFSSAVSCASAPLSPQP